MRLFRCLVTFIVYIVKCKNFLSYILKLMSKFLLCVENAYQWVSEIFTLKMIETLLVILFCIKLFAQTNLFHYIVLVL